MAEYMVTLQATKDIVVCADSKDEAIGIAMDEKLFDEVHFDEYIEADKISD